MSYNKQQWIDCYRNNMFAKKPVYHLPSLPVFVIFVFIRGFARVIKCKCPSLTECIWSVLYFDLWPFPSPCFAPFSPNLSYSVNHRVKIWHVISLIYCGYWMAEFTTVINQYSSLYFEVKSANCELLAFVWEYVKYSSVWPFIYHMDKRR